MEILRKLKLAVIRGADHLGAISLVARTGWRNRRLLILCYHGVSLDDEHECSDLHVSPEHLRRRFQILRAEECSVLSLQDGVERLFRGNLPPRSVVLTFDDAAYNFKVRAYPLLQEFDYPATLYVPTYYCTPALPVFDTAASYLLWKGRGRVIETYGLTPHTQTLVVPEDRSRREALFLSIRAYLNEHGTGAEEKDLLLAKLCNQLGFDWDAFVASRVHHLLTPSELASFDPRLVDIQLHTHRHRTPRDEGLFSREIDDNIAALQSMGFPRAKLRHFCYPSDDVDPMFFPWLKARGVTTATTCDPQIATKHSNPLRLPRLIDTMSMTEREFRSWLSGFSSVLPQRGSA